MTDAKSEATFGERETRSITRLLVGGFLALLALTTLTWLLASNTSFPDQTLPVELVGGLSTFLIALGLLALLFRRLGIMDGTEPLGMPSGSIRAIIALILILLFFLLVVFVYFDLARPPERTLQGITAAQLAQIPVDELATSRLDANGTYTVGRLPPKSTTATDIGKQVITTVSTLVVSISSFYFGAGVVDRRRRQDPSSAGTTAPTA